VDKNNPLSLRERVRVRGETVAKAPLIRPSATFSLMEKGQTEDGN